VALARQPYKIGFDLREAPWMTIMGEIGDTTFTNEDESYRPFIAETFVRDIPSSIDPQSENPE
jgi:hypothetical protein